MDDLISRQQAIDIERNATVDTNPSHFEAHQKFTQFMDDAEVLSFGRWQWANGFNTALTAVGIDLKKLPPAQPEPQWIPVSERMPRDGTWNIFTDGKNISVERYKADAIDHFFPNGRWFQLEDVIAWMPLPTPYTK